MEASCGVSSHGDYVRPNGMYRDGLLNCNKTIDAALADDSAGRVPKGIAVCVHENGTESQTTPEKLRGKLTLPRNRAQVGGSHTRK